MRDFVLTKGSVSASRKFYSCKPNQDAVFTAVSDNAIVAVVCDGCSAYEDSHVGAWWYCNKLGNALFKYANLYYHNPYPNDIQSKIDLLINNERIDNKNNLHFTSVGVMITPDKTVFFGVGDCLVSINGKSIKEIGLSGTYASTTDVFITSVLKTSQIDKILLASDGIKEFNLRYSLKLPGREEKLGNIDQFFDDIYINDAGALQNKLSKASVPYNGSNGVFQDDVSIVIIGKK